jgi:hypothetical protein
MKSGRKQMEPAAMGWSEIRNQALKDGELVYSFDQAVAADPSYAGKFDADAKVANGYCLGLCLQWCVLRLHGQDYAYSANRALSPSQTYRAASDHATYLKTFDANLDRYTGLFAEEGDVNTTATNVALAPYGLKLGGRPRTHRRGADAGFLLGPAEERGGIALIVWMGAEAAHATVIDVRQREGRVNYFDPNYGHFAFASMMRFLAWCSHYMQQSGYDRRYMDFQTRHMISLA